MEIEFATCAVNRPKLLDITYSTLIKHLKGVDFSKSILYINIDPTPTSKNLHKVEEVAKKYFGKVVTNYSYHVSNNDVVVFANKAVSLEDEQYSLYFRS